MGNDQGTLAAVAGLLASVPTDNRLGWMAAMIMLIIMLMMMTCIGLIVIDAVDVYDATFARDGSPGQFARDVICDS